MQSTYSLSKTDLGWLDSAFFLPYAFMQVSACVHIFQQWQNMIYLDTLVSSLDTTKIFRPILFSLIFVLRQKRYGILEEIFVTLLKIAKLSVKHFNASFFIVKKLNWSLGTSYSNPMSSQFICMPNVSKVFRTIPACIYLLKVNYRNTRKKCEICSELTIKTPERRQWRTFTPCSTIFTVNFEHVIGSWEDYCFRQGDLFLISFVEKLINLFQTVISSCEIFYKFLSVRFQALRKCF